jgi:hypothetical protein
MHFHSAPAARFSSSSCGVLLALLVALWAAPAVDAAPPAAGQVSHVVIFWLKEPNNEQHRQQIARACEELGKLPGVLRVEVGHGMPVQREGIEQAFDMSVVFTLRDSDALVEYQRSPEHKRAVESVLKPLVTRYIVFDSVVR